MSQRSKRDAKQDRRVLLDEAPLMLGTKWAQDLCEAMDREGRPVVGGWPGTISEARGRARTFLDSQLASQGLALLSYDELLQATHSTYDHARRVWLLAAAGKRSFDD